MLVGGGKSRMWGDDIEVPSGLDQVRVNQVVEALESAMVASAQNLPYFDRAIFATDVSGSMMSPVSPRSVVQGFDVGTVLCMMAYLRSQHSVTGMFGNDWKVVNFPKENILRNANEIRQREGEVGYSTNGYKVLEWANDQKMDFDNIFIFTDCQLYGSGRAGGIVSQWNTYKQRNPNANLYLFDLNGYGRGTPLDIRENGVHLISGWSDKIFDVLDQISKGGSAVDTINEVEF
jgi:60 kDa SS-A/Ro ribonucleoprotein